jgi:diadenosine tetraphosphate (Ap4A) HIT family hydrolase
VLLPVLLIAFVADIRGCVCDPVRPETMQGRECGLTLEATHQAADTAVFFIKDANPTKPNRWLAIPHALRHSLNEMTPEERSAYWSAAIEKARSLWQDQWGIAINSYERRTQCQLHAHIGKLLDTTDRSGGILVDRVSDIPVPPEGTGIWIHPEGSKLRVHSGEAAPETGLMR